MKGLLIKDLNLMKNMMRVMVAIVVFSVIFSTIGENLFFCMGYVSVFVAVFSVSTISYDEYDNGFDMTLAPSSVDIPVGGYVEVKLYSVIDNGWEYFDLFFGDTKLGDIVAY